MSVPDLPPRMTTSELLALGRISAATFRRRRRSKQYVIEPCDRGAEDLWKREDVFRIFDLVQSEHQAPAEAPRPRVSPDAIREARSRQVRQRPGPQGRRDVPGAVRGAGKTPAIRLAFDASAAD